MDITEYSVIERADPDGLIDYIVNRRVDYTGFCFVGSYQSLSEAMEYIATDRNNPFPSFTVDYAPIRKGI